MCPTVTHRHSSQTCTLSPALCVRSVGVPLKEDLRLHLLQEGPPPKALPLPPTAVRDADGTIGVQPSGPQAGGEGGSKLGRGRGSAWCLHTLGPSTSALSSHGSWKVFGLILWCRGMQGAGEAGSGRGSSR